MIGSEVALYITTAAYAAASALYFAGFAGPEASAILARRAHRALAVAVLAHAIYVVTASVIADACPVLSLDFFGSMAALVASLSFLLVRRRAKIDGLGAYLAPIALALVLGSHLLGAPRRGLGGALLALHVTANVIGDALFLLATVAAALYLVEHHRIKGKHPAGIVGRLPALDSLDRAEHGFLLTGFALLSVGIATGIIRARAIGETSTGASVRALLAWGTWIVFGGVIGTRFFLGWRGRRAALGTIAGFAFAVAVVVAYAIKRSGWVTP
jgi:ABC-type uncharacterized transport system permease subunit